MKFKNEDQLVQRIKKAVANRPSAKNIAVFDADGTLWFQDINDILLTYQIQQRPDHFKELLSDKYQKDRSLLCETFAKKQAGMFLSEFRFQSRLALSQSPFHVFDFQRKLLAELKKQGMTIVIISASIQYLIEEAIKKYDLPVDRVLSVQMKQSKDGILSDKIIQPSSYKDKLKVFLKHYPLGSCFLVAGNTPSDLPLLEHASLSLVVHSAQPDNVIYQKELKMKQLAQQKKWLLFEKNQ